MGIDTSPYLVTSQPWSSNANEVTSLDRNTSATHSASGVMDRLSRKRDRHTSKHDENPPSHSKKRAKTNEEANPSHGGQGLFMKLAKSVTSSAKIRFDTLSQDRSDGARSVLLYALGKKSISNTAEISKPFLPQERPPIGRTDEKRGLGPRKTGKTDKADEQQRRFHKDGLGLEGGVSEPSSAYAPETSYLFNPSPAKKKLSLGDYMKRKESSTTAFAERASTNLPKRGKNPRRGLTGATNDPGNPATATGTGSARRHHEPTRLQIAETALETGDPDSSDDHRPKIRIPDSSDEDSVIDDLGNPIHSFDYQDFYKKQPFLNPDDAMERVRDLFAELDAAEGRTHTR